MKCRKVWGYGYNKRYVGCTTKKKFIEEVSKRENISKNWVKERVAETGNKKEIEKANKNPKKIIRIK